MADDIRNNEETEEMENDNIVELTDEDGNAVQFEHLATLEHEGKKYLALMPLEAAADEETDEEEGEVLLLEIAQDENGEDVYVSLEDEALAETVFQKFLALMEEEDEE